MLDLRNFCWGVEGRTEQGQNSEVPEWSPWRRSPKAEAFWHLWNTFVHNLQLQVLRRFSCDTLTDFLVFSGGQPCLLMVKPSHPLTNPAVYRTHLHMCVDPSVRQVSRCLSLFIFTHTSCTCCMKQFILTSSTVHYITWQAIILSFTWFGAWVLQYTRIYRSFSSCCQPKRRGLSNTHKQ